MRWKRARSSARWALTAATALLIAAWFMSRWWALNVTFARQRSISLHAGCLWLSINTAPPVPELVFPPSRYVYLVHMPYDWGWNWRFASLRSKTTAFVAVPLWWFVVLGVSGTGFAWWRRRSPGIRRRAGACASCGYDRTGLARDAACPECGAVPG